MAADTTVIVQLSDSHLRPDEPHRAVQFAEAIRQVTELEPAPVAVLLTGDVADHGVRESYESAAELLAALPMPVHVIPGNHDDRATMRGVLGAPGEDDDEIRFAVQAGPIRVIGCDTLIPGSIEGQLDVAWLAGQLAEAPTTPTLIAMHHPPVQIGFAKMDGYGLPATTRAALEDLLAEHPQVLKIVTGHVHRAASAQIGRVPVITAPSVNFQLDLDLVGDRLAVGEDPPGFMIHVLVDGQLVSHVQPVLRV
ncbi:MAG: phosphodiesterase [Solirubrobacteraceae bacterium]|nr:phosphodiesterase [Solirubrobacteraceae bacterium]